DKISITIAFDSLCNIMNQELIDIVFITSSGKTLIWRADDINIEKQWQKEVIAQIHILFEETKELNIRANCLITDLAGLYAAACHNTASDDELKLPANVKAAINHDSFWNSLVALYNILYPFCDALDIIQCDKACLYNDLVINKWEELLINEELEEECDDLDNTKIDFLDTEIHLAENQTAK
ncbi:3236_t:CDS:2, partial [Dentiscutata heterogama]